MSTSAVKGLAQTLNGIGVAEKVMVDPFFQTRTLPDTLDWATRGELKFWGMDRQLCQGQALSAQLFARSGYAMMAGNAGILEKWV
jgi:hypothetical protein